MPSRATIKVEPHQHVKRENKKIRVKVDFDPGNGPDPNDVHIDYRPLGDDEWESVVSLRWEAQAGNVAFDYHGWELTFAKPDKTGTYDVRVVWTLNGRPMKDGERIGQFFVDP